MKKIRLWLLKKLNGVPRENIQEEKPLEKIVVNKHNLTPLHIRYGVDTKDKSPLEIEIELKWGLGCLLRDMVQCNADIPIRLVEDIKDTYFYEMILYVDMEEEKK